MWCTCTQICPLFTPITRSVLLTLCTFPNCILPCTLLSFSFSPSDPSNTSYPTPLIPQESQNDIKGSAWLWFYYFYLFIYFRLCRSWQRFWFDEVNSVFSICTALLSPVMSLWWRLMREAWPAGSWDRRRCCSALLWVVICLHPHLITRGGGLEAKQRGEERMYVCVTLIFFSVISCCMYICRLTHTNTLILNFKYPQWLGCSQVEYVSTTAGNI